MTASVTKFTIQTLRWTIKKRTGNIDAIRAFEDAIDIVDERIVKDWKSYECLELQHHAKQIRSWGWNYAEWNLLVKVNNELLAF